MSSAWFYVAVFLIAVGVPASAVYFVADKYDDKLLFYASTVLCALFIGGALFFSYARERWFGK